MKQVLQLEKLFFYLLILFLPTQLGKHFWPDHAFVQGLRIDYLAPTIYFTDLVIVLLFISWAFRFLSQTRESKPKFNFKVKNHTGYIIGVGVISYHLSVGVLSGQFWQGLYIVLKMLEMGFVGLYIAKFVSIHYPVGKTIAVFSVGVVFQSALAIMQFINQGSVGGALYYLGERTFTGATPGISNASINGELVLRPYGTLPHPNVLAGYLLVGMILVLYSLHLRKKIYELRFTNYDSRLKKRMLISLIPNSLIVIKILIIALSSIALFLTMSRGAIFLWTLVFAHYFFKKINLKVFAVGAFSTIAAIFLSPLGVRFTKLALTDEAIVQRVWLIRAAFQMIEYSPLFGVGLGNFIPTLAVLAGPLTISTYLQPVHNIFVLIAVETGVIGLGFFIWFLRITILRIKNDDLGSKKMFYALFFSIVILGLFDHYFLTLQQGQLLFVFALGLFWSKTKPQLT